MTTKSDERLFDPIDIAHAIVSDPDPRSTAREIGIYTLAEAYLKLVSATVAAREHHAGDETAAPSTDAVGLCAHGRWGSRCVDCGAPALAALVAAQSLAEADHAAAAVVDDIVKHVNDPSPAQRFIERATDKPR